jgi:serpin B
VQFDEKLTKEDDFTTLEQKTVKVPMMNIEQHFNYASTNDLQVLQMSYKGDDLSMLVLLPKDSDLISLEKKLSVENLNEWKSNLAQKQVNVYLPKFKLETTYSLVENLRNMGMSSVFDPGQADLSGINNNADLYVTGVFHKAFVAVDEKGTEAAAATGIVVGTTSVGPQPEIFRADHPFIFLIQDDRTGLILFMGKVIDPTKLQ